MLWCIHYARVVILAAFSLLVLAGVAPAQSPSTVQGSPAATPAAT